MKLIASLLSVLSLAAIAPTQSPLTTLYSGGNGGSAGWMNMFDLSTNTGLQITQFDLNISSSSGAPGTIDVYLTAPGGTFNGNQFIASAWSLASSSATFTSAGANVATSAILNTPITLAPGQYGVAILYNGVSMSYTNGNGSNQTYSTAEMTLNAGCSITALFSGSINTPRVWNGAIHYLVGSNFASGTVLGTGCGGTPPATMYELFPGAASPFDLSNSSFQMLWTGDGYIVLNSTNQIVPGVGNALSLTDDSYSQLALPWPLPTQNGSTSIISVCSNGYITLGASTRTDYVESVALFLSSPMALYALWDDLNPSAGGNVTAGVDPNDANVFHVTFNSVAEYSTTNQNTFQVSFHRSGEIEIKYGAVASIDSLVGYTKGSGSADPGPTDLSALTAHVIASGRPDLALASIARPVIGTTATVQTRNIPANSPAGAVGFGVFRLSPGFDLSVIGMTGCTEYASIDATLNFFAGGTTASHSLGIPNMPNLAGAHVYLQTFLAAPGANSLGAIASNAIDWSLNVQ